MVVTEGRNYLDPAVLDKVTRLDLRARLVVEGTPIVKTPWPNPFANTV